MHPCRGNCPDLPQEIGVVLNDRETAIELNKLYQGG